MICVVWYMLYILLSLRPLNIFIRNFLIVLLLAFVWSISNWIRLTSNKMSQLIPAVRVAATAKPAKSAIIFVHGLGDSGSGWSWFPQLAKQSNIIKNCDSINYVFPNAPSMPISANGGYVMPGWFDIYEFGNPDAKQDVEGFHKSCDTLKSLIKEQIETHNIPADKIIIGGFSQGAAVSLGTLALLDFKVGGVVALSGFSPIKDSLPQVMNKANLETPIFQGHGTADPIINYDYGKQTSELYQKLGFTNAKFHTYPGVVHSASEEELADAMKFIDDVLNK